MALVLFLGTFPNNCDVLSGGNLLHKSHLLSTECPSVYESDYSIHNSTECNRAHVCIIVTVAAAALLTSG